MRGLVSYTGRATVLIVAFTAAICILTIAATASKVTATPLVPPATPTLITPGNNSSTNDPTISFVWSEIDGALSYELRYAETNDCVVDPEQAYSGHAGQFMATNAIVAAVLEPRISVDDLDEGLWCWQVRAVSALGGYGTWSEPRAFFIDRTPPVVEVDQPFVPGSLSGVINEKVAIALTIDGVSRSDVKIVLRQELNADNMYDWSLELPQIAGGNHTYTLRAADAAGNETTIGPVDFVVETLPVGEATIITNTQHEMLPLLPMGPLVFIASPAREPTDIDLMTPVIDMTTARAMAVEAPGRVERLAATHVDAPLSENPVQATGEGWMLFGVPWYWWGISGGLGVVIVWILFLRVQLASRLNWIGAV